MSKNFYALYLEFTTNGQPEVLSQWAERQDFPFPFTCTLPCGHVVTYATAADIPLFDTPCPCGDGRHWLVKYGG